LGHDFVHFNLSERAARNGSPALQMPLNHEVRLELFYINSLVEKKRREESKKVEISVTWSAITRKTDTASKQLRYAGSSQVASTTWHVSAWETPRAAG
jgi:hypothetical protein